MPYLLFLPSFSFLFSLDVPSCPQFPHLFCCPSNPFWSPLLAVLLPLSSYCPPTPSSFLSSPSLSFLLLPSHVSCCPRRPSLTSFACCTHLFLFFSPLKPCCYLFPFPNVNPLTSHSVSCWLFCCFPPLHNTVCCSLICTATIIIHTQPLVVSLPSREQDGHTETIT